MRLDWFLPCLRISKAGRPERPVGRLARFAARILPASCFSDRRTKQRGQVRRFLRWMGPVWYSAPWRRVSQTVCFFLFLWLFFVVCWPYSAIPRQGSSGWIPVEFEVDSRRILLVNDDLTAAERILSEQGAGAQQVFVQDPSRGTDSELHLPAFALDEAGAEDSETVVGDSAAGSMLHLLAPENLSAEVLDELSLSAGPWTLYRQDAAAWPSHYADHLAAKERIAAELFLVIDPLVSISTAIASRSWVWSLTSAAMILTLCIFVPRGFCGYLCPLGTLIDLFDWLAGSRITRFRVAEGGWWVHIRYYLLLSILIAAGCGVLVSGMFAAIPVITRGLLFTLAPLQNGAANGWYQIPPLNGGHFLSVGLFGAVLMMGFLRPRFWCKYVCPSGAVFSVGNLFRVTERKVESSCIHCNKCVEICPFDAIKADFTTRTTDCTLCQSCGGVCPTHAIKFVGRWEAQGLKVLNDPPTHETPLGRRGFMSALTGLAASVTAGVGSAAGIRAGSVNSDGTGSFKPVRPPGSVPEDKFLQMCIRCGECFKACPSDVLQPLGFQQGLDGLWTPHVVADWAGCASSCNGCGQVCPTGAIRALPMEEKRHARMGLAFINQSTCLPIAGREACQLCVDECTSAGYRAIEFITVGTRTDELGNPIEGTGFLAPLMIDDRCVGCGLCQTRCFAINVTEKRLLTESAIVIRAVEGHEDRLMTGSYR